MVGAGAASPGEHPPRAPARTGCGGPASAV